MKRAILLLAAAVSMAGCHSHCDVSDLALYWTFSGQAGNALSCDAAQVANVRITIDEQPPFVETVGCVQPDVNGVPTQGILLTDFLRGFAYPFTLEGLDAGGVPIYLDQFVYTPNGFCGAERRDRVLTSIAGDLNVTYSFTDTAQCHSVTANSGAPTTFIWFELLDQNGQPVAVVDATNNATSLPCGAGNFTIDVPNVPFGQVTVSRIQEVEIDRDGTTVIVWHYNCLPGAPFQHLTPGETIAARPMGPQAVGGQVTCF